MDINFYNKVESIIGYVFKDKELLIKALTHSSVNTNKQENYERLEFLGDSILNFLVAEHFFLKDKNQSEGSLTQKRSNLVNAEALSRVVTNLKLNQFIILGNSFSNQKISIKGLSNVYESILGAMYLDSSKNIAKCRAFINNTLIKYYANEEMNRDYKSLIISYAQKNKLEIKFIEEKEGEDHNPTFICNLMIDDQVKATGRGKRKKIAENQASYFYFKDLKNVKLSK